MVLYVNYLFRWSRNEYRKRQLEEVVSNDTTSGEESMGHMVDRILQSFLLKGFLVEIIPIRDTQIYEILRNSKFHDAAAAL